MLRNLEASDWHGRTDRRMEAHTAACQSGVGAHGFMRDEGRGMRKGEGGGSYVIWETLIINFSSLSRMAFLGARLMEDEPAIGNDR